MSIGVLRNEKGSLENVEDVLGGCGRRVSARAGGLLLNLVEENVCGLWVVSAANTVR